MLRSMNYNGLKL